MIEMATLAKLITWASTAAGAAETVKRFWPKSWTNVEARFAVEEIGLGFSCDDKSVGWFRVTVLDPNLEKIAYMEGANSDDARPKIAINIRRFPHDLLREMFQMARCMREFERTDNRVLAKKYQSHRRRVVSLWHNPSEEGAERLQIEQKVIDIIAEVGIEVPKEQIRLESRLIEDLCLEELDLYDMIALIEDEWKLEISDEDLGVSSRGGWSQACGSGTPMPIQEIAEATTVQDIADCVWIKLARLSESDKG
jgi:acyl carrier protein